MLRHSRHLTTALLWLAIALLPLRGGMAAAMPHAMGGVAAQAQAQPVAEPAAMMSAACDEAASHSAHAAGDGHASSTHTCSLCSLCHSTAAAVAAMSLHISALPTGAPPAHASRDIVCAVFDAPERPPRLLA